jgi:chromosome segregation ATPase
MPQPQDNPLTELKNLHRAIKEGVATPRDVADIVKALTTVIREFKEKIAGELKSTGDQASERFTSLDASLATLAARTSDVGREVDTLTASTTRELRELSKSLQSLELDIEGLYASIPPEFDATGLERRIEEVRGLIPTLPEPYSDTEIRKEIEDLRQEIETVRSKAQTAPQGRMTGMRKIPITRAQDLTSQVDGVTKTFTLDKDTVKVLGVFGTQFPVNFNAGVDWTFNGRTLTLTSAVGAPETGQTLWALTEVLFYA